MPTIFLIYDDQKPLISECNKIAAYILWGYGLQGLSISKLKKAKLHFSPWKDRQGNIHNPDTSFDLIAKHIQDSRTFDHTAFDLPLKIGWLDDSIAMGGNTSNFKLSVSTVYGDTFPIKPQINGPGAIIGTFQNIIQLNIVRLHKALVNNSENAADMHAVWLNDLRLIINEAISLIEITLHQIYNMAKYRAVSFGWKFNETKLGTTNARRISDKFSWIKQITGNDLNANDLMHDFNELRELRNHLNHFDPPSFAFEVDDLTKWLNQIPSIGRLEWKLREAIGHPLNSTLVEIMSLPLVIPNPILKRNKDENNMEKFGYQSCIWSL